MTGGLQAVVSLGLRDVLELARGGPALALALVVLPMAFPSFRNSIRSKERLNYEGAKVSVRLV